VIRDHGYGAHLKAVLRRARAATSAAARGRACARIGIAGAAARARGIRVAAARSSPGGNHLAAHLHFMSDMILELIGASDELNGISSAGLSQCVVSTRSAQTALDCVATGRRAGFARARWRLTGWWCRWGLAGWWILCRRTLTGLLRRRTLSRRTLACLIRRRTLTRGCLGIDKRCSQQ
jgi:hypothetical protein